jgi:hypothetical protein
MTVNEMISSRPVPCVMWLIVNSEKGPGHIWKLVLKWNIEVFLDLIRPFMLDHHKHIIPVAILEL